MQPLSVDKNKTIFFVFAALLLAAAGIAAYYQLPFLLLLPFVLVLIFFLLQKLEYVFYLLIATIPWSTEYNFNGSLGTDLPDEPLMWLTSFAVVLWVIQHHQSLFKNRKIHPLLFMVALQLLWTIVTICFSTHPVPSVKYFLAKSWYLLAFVGAPLILFQDVQRLKIVFRILLCSMLIVILITAVRHAMNGFSFTGINPSLQPFFRNHVNYSSLLVCMAPLLIAAIQLSVRKKIKVILTALLIIVLFAVVTAYARGAWLALLAGLCSYWLIKKRILLLTFIFIVVCSAGTVFWLENNDRYLQYIPDYKTTIFHSDFKEHLVATYEMKDVSNAERFYRWIAGVRMVKDKWTTGFGPTTFYDNYKSYTLPAFKTWVSNNEEHSTVHNYFLLTLIEQGIMGLILLLLLIGYAFYTAQKIYHRTPDRFWKITAAALAVILTMIGTVNFLSDLIETDKVGSVFYLCLAALVVADTKTRKQKSDNRM